MVKINIRGYEEIYKDIEDVGEKINKKRKEEILIRKGLLRGLEE